MKKVDQIARSPRVSELQNRLNTLKRRAKAIESQVNSGRMDPTVVPIANAEIASLEEEMHEVRRALDAAKEGKR